MRRDFRIYQTFVKRNWGSGKLTWRQLGSCVLAKDITAIRRLNNKQSKRKRYGGDVLCIY